ncbi:MAG: DNA-binding proteins Bright/BRCAA1/RBP1 and proteins containing BRIGHT domain [Bathelium mastoideum]|nr:MAG: DNA-binding proteins Bright/BRCAA1/RBP1 and proteins containing BRIGHT domain [Bathelium mastoideum]
MASAASNGISNLTLALATKFKQDSNHAASFATDSAKGAAVVPSNHRTHPGLLTPPNSISPIIPPQLSSNNHHQPPHSVDSDVDLQDAVDHAKHQDQPHCGDPSSYHALTDLDRQESEGAITPAVLAEHHLPSILLGNGPIPIRYITGCLTQSLPGFASIPPAKARRIIVSALEGRYHGGTDREVVYDKVGWGRWEARMKGQSVPETRRPSLAHRNVSPPASVASSTAVSNVMSTGRRDVSGSNSWFGDSVMTPPAEDMDMAEHEAEKMSLDGDEGTDFEEEPASEDAEETEEEDWAAIGAEALRNGYYSKSVAGKNPRHHHKHCHHPKPTKLSSRHDKTHHHLHFARSAPPHPPYPYDRRSSYAHSRHPKPSKSVYIDSSNIAEQNAQERAAAEALLRLVSM